MPELSQRLKRFSPSLIGEMWSLANQMKQDGLAVYDLTSGEPDFDSDPVACAAGHRAIDEGDTKYTENDGTTALKAAIRRKFVEDSHPEYVDACLAVGSGAKTLLANILMTILNADDEVIVPAPCWASYPGMVEALEAKAVVITSASERNYKLSADALRAAISTKTRALILCTPNNPTGTVYHKNELLELAKVLRHHPEIWIVVDEIYSEIIFDDTQHHSLAVLAPDLAERIVTINGLSKSHAMTGWRIGYAAGPEALMNGLRQLISQIAGSPSSISQAAAIAALDGPQDLVEERRLAYQSRRDYVMGRLREVPDLQTTKPEGAFYLYVDCQAALGKRTADGELISSSADLTLYFLKAFSVAVVPAEAFQDRAAFRLSFASSLDNLEKACDGIENACRGLS